MSHMKEKETVTIYICTNLTQMEYTIYKDHLDIISELEYALSIDEVM